jgi:hypothetical protein
VILCLALPRTNSNANPYPFPGPTGATGSVRSWARQRSMCSRTSSVTLPRTTLSSRARTSGSSTSPSVWEEGHRTR